MRWKRGNLRCVKRFALWPVRIKEEYRWLETVYIIQRRLGYERFWHNESFEDEEVYNRWNQQPAEEDT